MTKNNSRTCVHCGQVDSQVPLILFYYQDQERHICTEHLPVLIHTPTKLTGKLPDMDKINPVDLD